MIDTQIMGKWNERQRSLCGLVSGYWTTFKGTWKQQGTGAEISTSTEVEKTNTVAQEGIKNNK